MNRCLENIDVAILAGGLGTRVRHILKDTPKILAPVDGRPFLDILLEWLAGFGARRVVLGLGHLAGAVEEHLQNSSPREMEVVIVIESKPLGTAGAVRNLLNEINTDPVMMMNGDSFIDADLCAYVAAHKASGAEASLLCAQVDDAARYGLVDVGDGGQVLGFKEKDPSYHGAGSVSAGVYLFSAPMLARINKSSGPSLERDIFQTMDSTSLHAMTGPFPFIDIGSPETINAASKVVLSCLNR